MINHTFHTDAIDHSTVSVSFTHVTPHSPKNIPRNKSGGLNNGKKLRGGA